MSPTAGLFCLCVALLSVSLVIAQPCPTRTRKEYRDTTTDEWNLFREALLLMQTRPSTTYPGLSEWDAYAKFHNDLASQTHGTLMFLIWHRAFLMDVENHLRSIDPKYANVFIPYWDWALDWADPPASDIFNPNSRYNLYVQPGANGDCNYRRSGPSPHCLSRNYDPNNFMLFYSSEAIAVFLVQVPQYNWFEPAIEYAPHAMLHVGFGGNGGDLSQMYSPNDPLFWLLHSSLDYIWFLWQQLNPNLLTDIGGIDPSTPIPGYPGQTAGSVLDAINQLCYNYQDFSQDTILSLPGLHARRFSGATDDVPAEPNSDVTTCLPKPASSTWIQNNGLDESAVRDVESKFQQVVSVTQTSKKCSTPVNSVNAAQVTQVALQPQALAQPLGPGRTTTITTTFGDNYSSVPGWGVGLLVLGAIVLAAMIGVLLMVVSRR